MSRAAPTLETLLDGEGADPPYLYPDYRSTELRAPKRPLLLLPHPRPRLQHLLRLRRMTSRTLSRPSPRRAPLAIRTEH